MRIARLRHTRLIIFVAMVLVSLVFFVKYVSAQTTPQKKEHRIRVVTRENGRLVETDTVVVNMPNGGINFKGDSIVVLDDKKSGQRQMTVFVTKGQTDKGSSQTSTYTVTTGDTLIDKGLTRAVGTRDGKKIIIMRDGNSSVVSSTGSPDHFRTVTDYPSSTRDPFNATDPDIVSYRKKDLKNGLEKVTVIRKKRDTSGQIRDVEVEIKK